MTKAGNFVISPLIKYLYSINIALSCFVVATYAKFYFNWLTFLTVAQSVQLRWYETLRVRDKYSKDAHYDD